MKTTLELPDVLMRRIKIRAAEQNRKLKDTVAELLERGLAAEAGDPATVRNRVRLPLVRCVHPASEEDQLTPDRVAQILVEEDVRAAVR